MRLAFIALGMLVGLLAVLIAIRVAFAPTSICLHCMRLFSGRGEKGFFYRGSDVQVWRFCGSACRLRYTLATASWDARWRGFQPDRRVRRCLFSCRSRSTRRSASGRQGAKW